MEIYKSIYQTITYEHELSCLENIWALKTEDISDDGFRSEIIKFRDCIEQYKPKYLIGNVNELRFGISPDFQNWIVENLFAKIVEWGVKKYAVLVSTDILTQLSVEQTIEEEKTGAFATRYFDNRQTAVEWIKA